MLIYEDHGPHPRRPMARYIIAYHDDDMSGREFCYYGYRDSRCYMKLYPCDRETVQTSKRMRIAVSRIRPVYKSKEVSR